MRLVIFRGFLRWFGYDIVRVKAREESKTTPNRHSLPQLPKSEISDVKEILKDYVQKFGHEPGQYRTYKAAARYLNETRMRKQFATVEFAFRNGVDLSGRIVDVGSGTGYLLRSVKRFARGSELWGFDPSPKTERLAPMLCPAATFKRELLSEREGAFDVALCTQVLEHLVNPEALVYNLYKVLNPGGCLVLTVPDGRYNFLEAGRFSKENGAYEGHVNFWSPESWRHWLEKIYAPSQIITETHDLIGNLALIRKEVQG